MAKEKKTSAPAREKPNKFKTKVEGMAFDLVAVALYMTGTKVVDIAVALGYERGQGQNRVTDALIKEGVYKGTRKARTKAAATA